ncbi:F15k9.21, putative isoform 2 [Melia azedarach]|uniref:F15k9.21, putative isoform 2 n=2 Tax=Melia azedarach TaxID=155640 RepID=A0ACC1YUW1_MELAZ|nr:F15k9.21, putative isoform 2 [Melia azedarach]KAJ4727491.1 F15k9.21, putative isoform 2 [Melia azedarach]
MQGEGSLEMEFTDIETSADSLDSSAVFHIIKDVVAFVLYMHQQIPSILQDISVEFDALRTEYKESEMALRESEVKAASRRKHLSRMREIKHGIRRLGKLMNTVSSLQTALQLVICEIPNIQEVLFILGASPLRPLQVYQLCFSNGKSISKGEIDFSKSKAAEVLSRKAIRALISKGAGSVSYPGPTKLFVLVKASSALDLPLHFLPKRDFRCSKKIVPFRLRFKCKIQDREMNATDQASQTCCSTNLTDSNSNDFIWFQCRHIIKGIASSIPTEE